LERKSGGEREEIFYLSWDNGWGQEKGGKEQRDLPIGPGGGGGKGGRECSHQSRDQKRVERWGKGGPVVVRLRKKGGEKRISTSSLYSDGSRGRGESKGKEPVVRPEKKSYSTREKEKGKDGEVALPADGRKEKEGETFLDRHSGINREGEGGRKKEPPLSTQKGRGEEKKKRIRRRDKPMFLGDPEKREKKEGTSFPEGRKKKDGGKSCRTNKKKRKRGGPNFPLNISGTSEKKKKRRGKRRGFLDATKGKKKREKKIAIAFRSEGKRGEKGEKEGSRRELVHGEERKRE